MTKNKTYIYLTLCLSFLFISLFSTSFLSNYSTLFYESFRHFVYKNLLHSNLDFVSFSIELKGEFIFYHSSHLVLFLNIKYVFELIRAIFLFVFFVFLRLYIKNSSCEASKKVLILIDIIYILVFIKILLVVLININLSSICFSYNKSLSFQYMITRKQLSFKFTEMIINVLNIIILIISLNCLRLSSNSSINKLLNKLLLRLSKCLIYALILKNIYILFKNFVEFSLKYIQIVQDIDKIYSIDSSNGIICFINNVVGAVYYYIYNNEFLARYIFIPLVDNTLGGGRYIYLSSLLYLIPYLLFDIIIFITCVSIVAFIIYILVSNKKNNYVHVRSTCIIMIIINILYGIFISNCSFISTIFLSFIGYL